ncbi:unnamed protein product [Paramecium primaurelia]|uniref:Uncharacterized protein n=1 Tax=Paramecium primaurelia TaxID=5886 RepID=A0A8S1QRI3_PARPR|nr:unnamed protein product [Paramecium primaurelia]
MKFGTNQIGWQGFNKCQLNQIDDQKYIQKKYPFQLPMDKHQLCEDAVFNFLLNRLSNINYGDDFEPYYENMDFLFELGKLIIKTRQYNWSSLKSHSKDQVFNKNIVEPFNFAVSHEIAKPFESRMNQQAIVQAYCNSDRCYFTHPELAYFD